MSRNKLTDRKLQSLKAAPSGKHYDVWDRDGFGVRVSDTGRITFTLMARYPGKKHATRQAIGRYPAISLAEARHTADQWLKLIERGVHPADEIEAERQRQDRKRANTFTAVAEDFIAFIKRNGLRSANVMERDLRKLMAEWGSRPVAEITSGDVRCWLDNAVNRDAKYQAFHDFALIRRLFNWAIGTDAYGLELNPCRRLKANDVIGERRSRDRVLSDDEIRALWRATQRLSYPNKHLYQLLLLTGQRTGQVYEARWSQIDLTKKEWTTAASDMKKTKAGARPHMVPLTAEVIEVLKELPRVKGGDYLLSNGYGRKPLRSDSDLKSRVDKLMAEELNKIVSECGNDPVVLPNWVNHDIRRTVRTRLSSLRVADEVAEAVIAHVRPGIKGVYDLHTYADEKREALEKWNARLRFIVEPPPSNVVQLREAVL